MFRNIQFLTSGICIGLVLGYIRSRYTEPTADQDKEDPRPTEESTSRVDSVGSSSNSRTHNRTGTASTAATVRDPAISRSALEDCLACPVCLELPVTPLELGCDHTVCVRCTDVIMERSARLTVAQIVPKCPICRARITRPVFDLSVNYPVSNLVDRIMAADGKEDEHSAAKDRAATLLSERRRDGYPTGVTDASTIISRGPLPITLGVGSGVSVALE